MSLMVKRPKPYHVGNSNFSKLASLSNCSTSFSLYHISIYRWVAIVRPLAPRMSRKCAYTVLGSIWLGGILISLPNLLFSDTITYTYLDGSSRTLCYLVWPDGQSGHSYYEYIYNILFTVICYLIPIGSMSITYPWMGFVLWRSDTLGEMTTERQRIILLAKKKVRNSTSSFEIFPCHTMSQAY